jgi:hypothetical protein
LCDLILAAAEGLPGKALDFDAVPDAFLIHEVLDKRTDLFERFASLVVSYVRDGTPYAINPFGPRSRDPWSAGRFKTGADLFLLAHEFAHVAGGHFGPHDPPRSGVVILTAGGVVEIPERVRVNWDDEFEADSNAVRSLFHVAGRLQGEPSEFFAGAYLLLCGLRALRQNICTLQNAHAQESPLPSHPPIDTRLEVIRKVAASYAADGAVRRGQVLEYIVKHFNQQLSRMMVVAHLQGIRPSHFWNASTICQQDL